MLGTARLRLFATGCRSRVDARHVRPKNGSPTAQGLGRRRTKARRSDFCRRKDYLAGGYGRPSPSLKQPLQGNREMGLDQSSLLLAALSEFPAATSESPSWTTRAAILAFGRRRDDLRHGLRSVPAGQYIIIYRVRHEDVLILRMLYVRAWRSTQNHWQGPQFAL